MSRYSEMCEIIPGLLVGSAADAGDMVRKGAKVLVPLAFLDGNIWETGFRGEVIYCPIEDMKVLPDDVLRELVDKICARIDEGKKVGLFCGAGHGRTGYIAGCVLARRGIKDPIGYLRRNYSAKAVETEKQANSIFAYARSLKAEQIRSQGLGEVFFEYDSYGKSKQYVFLSFSEWDHDAAPEVVRILNEAGYRVAYDKSVLEGRLWSSSRSDAIEDCSLFITLRTPCENYSHIRLADHYFAEMLEKPIAYIETDEREWKYLDEEDKYICGRPSDPDFMEKCIKVLTLNGIEPAPDRFEEKGWHRCYVKKDRPWDLGISYYEHYGDGGRMFKETHERHCNLRTRETYDHYRNSLDKPSDEELYRAIGWKLIGFDLFPRSRGLDYYSSEADTEFRRRLCSMGGKRIPEIEAEYRKEQQKIDDYWRTYPYMDEFEYVSSGHDD